MSSGERWVCEKPGPTLRGKGSDAAHDVDDLVSKRAVDQRFRLVSCRGIGQCGAPLPVLKMTLLTQPQLLDVLPSG